MNNIHDLGGMQCFGDVSPEVDEPVFHHPWEARVLGLQRSILALGIWNIDVFRYAQESIKPAEYLRWSYYERWITTLTQTSIEKSLVSEEELLAEKGVSIDPSVVQKRLSRRDIHKAFVRGNFERASDAKPRFNIGDRVKTKQLNPLGHTRLPRYARGKLGTVIALRGTHVFPDSVVDCGAEDPQWLYTVDFSGRELWGEQCDEKLTVSIDAFEPYLLNSEDD